jgi:hypothetical protein
MQARVQKYYVVIFKPIKNNTLKTIKYKQFTLIIYFVSLFSFLLHWTLAEYTIYLKVNSTI